MESATNKKSFREEAVAVPVTAETFTPTVEAPEAVEFAPHSGVWDAFLADPILRDEFERRIDEEVQLRLSEETASYRERAREEARQEGYQVGLQEANVSLRFAEGRLSEISDQILKNQQTLLREHEAEWCQALSHIAKRFLFPKSEELVAALKLWIEQNLEEFSLKEKVRVYLSTDEYESMRGVSQNASRWELAVDTSLSPGEVRCECSGAGFFFSPQEQWDRLDEMLNRFLSEKSA